MTHPSFPSAVTDPDFKLNPTNLRNPAILIMHAFADGIVRIIFTRGGPLSSTAAMLLACALAGTGVSRAGAQVVKASIPTGPGASAIEVNPVTNTVYVASSSSNIVTVINGSTYSTSTVSVGAGPVAIDIDTATNKIFVANREGSSVTEIDGATKATSTIALHGTPTSIAVNSVTHKVYVPIDTFQGSFTYGAVELIDEATGAVTDLDKGIIPSTITINTVTNKIYVANSPQTVVSVTVFDGTDNSYSYVGDGTGPVAVDTVLDKVFVANLEGSLLFIDGVTGFYTPKGNGQYFAVAVNSTTHVAYASTGAGITVFNESTGNTTQINFDTLGSVIVVDAQTNKIFVSHFDSSSLTMIDGATNILTSLSVGPKVFAMAENPSTGIVFLLGNDAGGTVTAVDGRAVGAAPIFATQPLSVTAASGSPVALNAIAGTGAGASPTYQWSFDGAPLADGAGITGSASPTLFLTSVSDANAGTYTCTVAGSLGGGTSSPATLTVADGAAQGHLINLSSRSVTGLIGNTEPSPIIAGFVVSGPGPKEVILRGVGPTLSTFSVNDAVTSLSLSLFDSAVPANLITSDATWQTPPTAPAGPWAGKVTPADATAADFLQVGAFALPAGSADTALKVALPAGAYTAQLNVPASVTGEALAEVYDADPSDTLTHLSNLSARSLVINIPIVAGFVIAGDAAQTILIRASGPALLPFGVSDYLPAMQLQVFDSHQNVVASNSAWQGNPSVVAAAANVGAFAWHDPASADSALLLTLPPGDYTAQVSAVNGGGGTALVEVYGLH
jgi:DNA-binding beta-propeller fold protein YncE